MTMCGSQVSGVRPFQPVFVVLATLEDASYLLTHGAAPRRTSSVPTLAGTLGRQREEYSRTLAMQP